MNKNFAKNLKIFTKNDIFKSFFLLFIFFVIIFIFFNNNYLQFIANDFHKIANTDLKVYFLNVGNASANVVIFPNKTSMIIDTGSQASEDEFLKSVELIFSANKIKKVDWLVLTHSDEDHIGGAVSLLKKYQIDTIYRPKLYSNSTLEEPNNLYLQEVETQIYEDVIDNVLTEPNCEVKFIDEEIMQVGESTILKFWEIQSEKNK